MRPLVPILLDPGAEFDFRHSTHKISDEARVARLMGQVGGRRISYKRVKGS